jgi:carbon-monoxide dehydrogenase large subunit
MERLEDLRLLRGRGEFVDDIHLDGMLHAVVVRSTVAHGRIRSIDCAAARAMPGVRAVFTAAEIADSSNGSIPTIPLRMHKTPYEQPVIARDKVRYVGEPMALVVADSAALAEDAAEAVAVDVEPLPAVVDRQAAGGSHALLFEEQESNLALAYTVDKGDAGKWFAPGGAPYTRRETFSIHRHTAVPMEPRGLLAVWDAARTKLTVYGAAKIPFRTRGVLALQMDLPEECIDMIEGDVGGGFGVRGEFFPENYLVPFAARKLRRPVKWIEDRREHLLASAHARGIDCDLEIACGLDGKILGLRGRAWVDTGAYVTGAAGIGPRNVVQFMSGPYRIENISLESSMLLTNKAPIGVYRGPGRYEGDFFRERMFDIAARDLKIDPVEFRRRNLVTEPEMPYLLARIRPLEKREELDSGDYGITLERCLAEIRWAEKASVQGKLVAGRYHGLGIGCFIEGGASGGREHARLTIEPDGSVSVYVGSASLGQGLETVCVQIAADALEIPMSRIRIFHGSTVHLKDGIGSWHSRSTVMGGSAILDAASKLKVAMRKAQAEGRSTAGLSAEGLFECHEHTYAYGAAAAHVAVDPSTGQVEVLEYVTVEDLGKIVNPLTATGQAMGAVVQGLGGTFLEHLQYDGEGQFLTASLADYLLPTSVDFPNIKAIVLENSPSPNNPLGTKGGGEGGIVPVAGVVANAVAAALASFGVQANHLPLSPPRIWQLLQERKAS